MKKNIFPLAILLICSVFLAAFKNDNTKGRVSEKANRIFNVSKNLKAISSTECNLKIDKFPPAYNQVLISQYVADGSYPKNTTICRSANGLYRLVYQSDGNLVLYNNSGVGLWDSGSFTSYTNAYAIFTSQAGLQLNEASPVPSPSAYWNSGIPYWVTPYGHYWVLQDDGNFVCYVHKDGYIYISYSTSTEGGRKSKYNHVLRPNKR